MPWGLVVLGAFSLLVFRRARMAGRNPLGWVLVLWGAVFGIGIVAACVGYAVVFAGAPFEVLPATAISGMLAGAVLTTWASGQPDKRRPDEVAVNSGDDEPPPATSGVG